MTDQPGRRVEVFRVEQNGIDCYVGVMNSELLRRIATVSTRGPDNGLGYQRYLDQSRLKEVGEYISKAGATFPNSIVVCFDRDNARYEPSAEPHRGTLVLSDQPNTAFVVDGQHRLFGFDHAGGINFDLIIAVYIGLPVREQAAVFVKINSTQKGVNSSLIYDLLDLTKNGEYNTQRAHELVKALNEDVDSPWKDSIKMVGRGPGLVSQAAFVGELRKLVQAKGTIFADASEDVQLRFLKIYFNSWKGLFPTAWGSRKYILRKTLGVAAMLGVLGKTLNNCQIQASWTLATMTNLLEGVSTRLVPEFNNARLDFSSAQLSAYGGRQGQKKLAEILNAGIPDVRPRDLDAPEPAEAKDEV
jgi:DGQHR domain-containing protein